MFWNKTKKLTSLVIALVMVFSVTSASLTPVMAAGGEILGNTGGTPGNLENNKVLISQEQMEAYKLVDRTLRPKGVIGFTGDYELNGDGMVSVIVEFAAQPALIQIAEAEVNGIQSVSMSSAKASALSAHTQFRAELDDLMSGGSSANAYSGSAEQYEITSEYYDAINGVAVYLPADKVEALSELDSVWAVYPNAIVQVDPFVESYGDNDNEALGMSESRAYLNIGALHDRGLKGDGIVIGVIDTGVDYNHPSLRDAFATELPKAGSTLQMKDGKYYGRNFVERDPFQPIFQFITPQADNDPMEATYYEFISTGASNLVLDGMRVTWEQYVTAHGTHVAGTIAGRAGDDPASSVLGIAPNATLISYRVLGPFGAGYTEWILGGLDYVYEDGCDVVNMSLGAAENNAAYVTTLAVNNLIVAHDITFAIAVGNDGPAVGSLGSPGTSSLSIGVANGATPMVNHDLLVLSGSLFDPNRTTLTIRQLISDGVTQVTIEEEDWGWGPVSYVSISGGDLVEDPLGWGMTGNYMLVPLESQDDDTYDGTYTLLGELTWDGSVEYAIVLGKGTEADFAAMDPDLITGNIVLVGRGLPFIEVAERAKRYGVGMVLMLDYPEGGNQPDSFFEVSSEYAPLFLLRDSWSGSTHSNQNGYGWLQGILSLDSWNFDEPTVLAYFAFDDYIEEISPVILNSTSSVGPVSGTVDIKPDITAPGTSISSAVPYFVTAFNKTNPDAPGAYNGALGKMSGTSMASPHIAGIAALMLQYSREQGEAWSSAEIKARMMNTADTIDGDYSVYEIGVGFVNPNAAINAEAFVTVEYNDVYLPLTNGSLSNDRGSGQVASLNFRSLMVNQDIDQSVELSATLTNTGAGKTFNVSYSINEKGFVLANNESLIANANRWASSGVKIEHPGIITVGAGESVQFSVSAFAPSTVGNSHTGIYEGYLVLENINDSTEVYRLPFSLYLRPESAVGQFFLNHPVITTEGVFYSATDPATGEYAPGIYVEDRANDVVHAVESFYSALYLELGEPASYMAFFVAPGDISDIYDQSQYLGETGVMISLEGLEAGALVSLPYTFGPAYYEYEPDGQGGITVDPMRMEVFAPGHYKIIAMTVSPFGATLIPADLYVDNAPPVLTVPGLTGDIYTYYGGSRDEVTITGNIFDAGIVDLQNLGINYDVYEPTDPHGPEPDQALNAIFARVKGAPAGFSGDVYSQAVIQPNGDFELKLKGLNVSGTTVIDLYWLDHFAIADYSNVIGVTMNYEFDPSTPCLVKLFEYPFAFNGANMGHQAITVKHTGPAVVLNMQSAVRTQGTSLGLVPTLNQEAINAGFGNSFEWESSDPRVATVDSDGIVTMVNWGTAVITCKTRDTAGNIIYAGCTVYAPGNHDGVEIDPFSNLFVGQYEYGSYSLNYNDKDTEVVKSSKPYEVLIYGEDIWEHDPVNDMWIIRANYIGAHTRVPMMWEYKGEEVQNGLGDRMLTLSSTYSLTDMEYNADGEWTVYGESDIHDYLNGEFITSSFTEAEQNAIPTYTVTSGIYDENGNLVGEEVLEDQRAYLPWGIPGSMGGSYANYVFWSAGNDLDFDYSFKGASNWRNRGRMRDIAEIQWTSYYLRNRSPYANEVLYAGGFDSSVGSISDWSYYGEPLNWYWVGGVGVWNEAEIGYTASPVIKLDWNTILGYYTVLSPDSTYRGANENNLYAKVQETPSYKLALLGGNNGADVGTLEGVSTDPRSITPSTGLSFSVKPSKFGSKTVSDVPDYEGGTYSNYKEYDYVIAYKVVGGDPGARTIVKSGEVRATSANAHNLNLGTFSSGDYMVYVWLMNKCDRQSYEVGTVYSFPLNVSGGDSASAPVIDSQPQDVFAAPGVQGNVNVIANTSSMVGNLSYQWYSCDNANGDNPTIIPQATDRVYNFPNGTAGVYYYYVVVTNTMSGKANSTSVTSRVATVTLAESYTVTFDLNGGTSEPIAPITVFGGQTVTLPAEPTRESNRDYTYEFAGWFTAAEGGEQFTASTPVTGSVTVYAHWTATANEPITVKVSASALTTLSRGQSMAVTATVLPSNDSAVLVTWQSSNPNIAGLTPSDDGRRVVIKGTAPGMVVITCTITTIYGDTVKSTFTIRVV